MLNCIAGFLEEAGYEPTIGDDPWSLQGDQAVWCGNVKIVMQGSEICLWSHHTLKGLKEVQIIELANPNALDLVLEFVKKYA